MNADFLNSRTAQTTLWLVLVLLIGVPVYQYGILLGLWKPLTRPPSVSREAVHVAGFKTPPTWFDCRFDAVQDLNPCSVWSGDGKLIFEGQFRLEGQRHAAPPELLRPSGYSYAAYGISIHLRGPNTMWGPSLVSTARIH
ncbi:MAG: hypothetical protein H7039_16515 [Bryobacteraceae bacterium]|nr:hypothetical protein [Bryobacteraceae bacterium]